MVIYTLLRKTEVSSKCAGNENLEFKTFLSAAVSGTGQIIQVAID